MTEFRVPLVSDDRPAAAHLKSILARMTVDDWHQVLSVIPQVREFMIRIGPSFTGHGPASARSWVAKVKASSVALPDLLAICDIACGELARSDQPALRNIEPGEQTSQDLAERYLEVVARNYGRGPAILMLLGQQCIDGQTSPVALAEEELLQQIDAWAANGPLATDQWEDSTDDQNAEMTPSKGVTDRPDPPGHTDDESAGGDAVAAAVSRIAPGQERASFAVDELQRAVHDGERAAERDLGALTAWNVVLDDSSDALEQVLGQPVPANVSAITTADREWRARLQQDARRRNEQQLQQIDQQILALETLLGTALENARPGLQEALEATFEDRRRIVAVLDADTADRPTTPPDATPTQPHVEQSVETVPDGQEMPPEPEPELSEGEEPSVEPDKRTRGNDQPAAGPNPDLNAQRPSTGAPTAAPTVEASRLDAPTQRPTRGTADSQPAQPASAIETAAQNESGITRSAADLVQRGHLAGAYWLTRLQRGETAVLTRALRYAAAAFSSGPGGIPPESVTFYAAADLDPVALSVDPAAAAVVMAATARTALNAGYIGNEALLSDLIDVSSLPPEWRQLLTETTLAGRSGYRQVSSIAEPEADRDLAAQITQLQGILTGKRLNYEAATALLHHMAQPEGRLGSALATALRITEGGTDPEDAATLDSFLNDTRGSTDIDRLIHSADEDRRRVDRRIEGRAMKSLRTQVIAVRTLVGRAAGLRTSTADAGADSRTDQGLARDLEALFRAAPVLRTDTDQGRLDVGAAALEYLRQTILAPSPTTPTVHTLEELLRQEALRLPQLARDEEGMAYEPEPPLDLLETATTLLDPPSDAELLADYLSKGDLASAHEIAQRIGTADADSSLAKSELEWRARWHEQYQRVEGLLNHVIGSINPFLQSDLTARMQTLRELRTQRQQRYDIDTAELNRVRADLDAAVNSARTELVDHLTQIGPTETDAAHIRELLDAGDLPTARELIALLEAGENLPDADSQASPELTDLVAVLQRYQGDGSLDDVLALVGHPRDTDPRVTEGLRGWHTLTTRSRLGNYKAASEAVRAVLRLLGLDVVPGAQVDDVTSSDKGRSGFRTYRVTATANDGSIDPELGSLAHKHYRIIVVNTPRPKPEMLLAAIDVQAGQVATILLNTAFIDDAFRRDLADIIRRRQIKAIVVDNAVVALMLTRYPSSFRSLQRMTLPYAAYTFYTPSMAGEIPDEVFVGRRQELQEIAGTTGGMFVYGGRQLGKSALLRRTQREFAATHGHIAIYIDLLVEGIGASHEPDRLWPVLADELRTQGVLTARLKAPESVLSRTQEWLNADPQRRLLILLDEADRFLDAEAAEGTVGSRSSTFPNIVRLKALMQATERRFKVVFAGLHMVQRFQAIENSPLAHGGRDILVGPLDTTSARDLVQAPLRAMGYEFEDPDQLWRLLAHTNYVASLIQIVGLALVDHLHSSKRAQPGQPPVPITAADIDEVLASQAVQQEIVAKFRLTLHLDPRYKVIALVLAWLAGSAAFSRHSVAEVREQCRFWWPAGFEQLTAREFDRYISEMEGLGVVVKQGATVMLRSPNLVRMLGDRNEIEQEIEDANTLELPYDYHPSYTRRLLRPDSTSSPVRSPLTDQDLTDLIPDGSLGQVRVVIGSTATGVDRVPEAIKDAAGMFDREIRLLAPAEVTGFVANELQRKHQGPRPLPVLVVDTPGQASAAAAKTLAFNCRKRNQAGVIVVRNAVGTLLDDIAAAVDGDPVMCERWSAIGLRAFDHPFAERAQRAELIAATSGWPILVEQAVTAVQSGRSADDVLNEARAFPADQPQADQFMHDVGIDDPDIPALRLWQDLTAPGELLEQADISTFELSDITRTRLIRLGVIHSQDGRFRLDPVIYRCLAM